MDICSVAGAELKYFRNDIPPAIMEVQTKYFYRQFTVFRQKVMSKLRKGVYDNSMQNMNLNKSLEIAQSQLDEINFNLKCSKQGLHAVQQARRELRAIQLRQEMEEHFMNVLKGKLQINELDGLNDTAYTALMNAKHAMLERDDVGRTIRSERRVKTLEDLLDVTNKKFNVVNAANMALRHEIDVRLTDRALFTRDWNKAIESLLMGKIYLRELLENVSQVDLDRDAIMQKLTTLNEKGYQQMQLDINNMKELQESLNFVGWKEHFFRTKGGQRINKDELRRVEEEARLEMERIQQELAKIRQVGAEIYEIVQEDAPYNILQAFHKREGYVASLFCYTGEVSKEHFQTSFALRPDVIEVLRYNKHNTDTDVERGSTMSRLADASSAGIQSVKALGAHLELLDMQLGHALKEIFTLYSTLSRDFSPITRLLGGTGPNGPTINKHNVGIYLQLLHAVVVADIALLYSIFIKTKTSCACKTPCTCKKKGPKKKAKKQTEVHLPDTATFVPAHVDTQVEYIPCAYCAQEYEMKIVSNELVSPFDRADIDARFDSRPPNNSYGFFTSTFIEKEGHPPHYGFQTSKSQ